jgi:hypothetical protein
MSQRQATTEGDTRAATKALQIAIRAKMAELRDGAPDIAALVQRSVISVPTDSATVGYVCYSRASGPQSGARRGLTRAGGRIL